MKRQQIIISAICVVALFGIGFYGGMKYGENKTPSRGQFGSGKFDGNGQSSGQNGMRTRNGGGFTAGEIIAKDMTSMTLKMQNGSTKIILVSSSTQVMVSTSGTLEDVSVGTNVVVTGSSNSDGSITAQSLQVRPSGQVVIPEQSEGVPSRSAQ
ncbi:MAG: hypothetical protein HGA67_01830 [Candidatus Yonathbacteria bacterium]|nr:hypothetical protein [Candidatus Yonathbacteria bacterium]